MSCTKEDFLLLQFPVYLFRRVSFLAETFSVSDYIKYWTAYKHNSVQKANSPWKCKITETCRKRMLQETPKFIARYYISRAIQLALIVLDQ